MHSNCAFRAKTKQVLNNHDRCVHESTVKHACHLCTRGFFFKVSLRVHMKTHEADGHSMDTCANCLTNLKLDVIKSQVLRKAFANRFKPASRWKRGARQPFTFKLNDLLINIHLDMQKFPKIFPDVLHQILVKHWME